MVEVGPLAASLPDLLRLLAVPALGWAAWRDLRTRRVDNRLWPPLVVLGVVAGAIAAWDALLTGGAAWRGFVLPVVASLLILVPLAYLFWYFGAFGGADAKAVMALAVIFPTVPAYDLDGTVLPVVDPASGLFGLSILTNAAILAMGYPVALAARNLAGGSFRLQMLFGRPIAPERAGVLPGRLLETPDGFDRRGLDLDALRMYLNWRDATVADPRSDPARFRERGPDDPGDPGDGAIADGGAVDDPWAAEAFIEAVGHEPYGTSAETLRQGLELIATRDRVWYSPGIPFVALLALGLAVALGFGDIYSVLLAAVGVG